MSISNVKRPYLSKPLVDELHATADKISVLASRTLAADDISDEELLLFDRLVQRASDAVARIHEIRSHE